MFAFRRWFELFDHGTSVLQQSAAGLVCLGLAAACSGCSAFSGPLGSGANPWSGSEHEVSTDITLPEVPKTVSATTERHQEQLWLGDDKQHPLKLRVAQAFFSGMELHIKVHLLAKTEFPADQIVVAVRGLHEGQERESRLKVVSEAAGLQILRPGQLIVIPFSLQAKDLTEYQVRMSWGQEAKDIISESVSPENPPQGAIGLDSRESTRAAPANELEPPEPSAGLAGLTIEDLEVEEQVLACQEPPCEVLYTLRAMLVNRGSLTQQGASLALGLYWANEGQVPNIPDTTDSLRGNEEPISLPSLALEPGEGKLLRVRVDRPVPLLPGGRFVPHLRILRTE